MPNLHIRERIIDYYYALKGFSMMYMYKNPPSHYLDNANKEKKSVIILQGYLNRWGFMKNLADEVSRSGYPVYVFPELKNNLDNVSAASEFIYEEIIKRNIEDIIIVGHSKGGLIGKYILTYLDKKERIRGVIAVATPFNGTTAAEYFKSFKTNEFQIDSKLIKELGLNTKYNNKIISISALYDNVVRHEKKARLDGAFKNIEVKASGHHKIIFDKKVKELIIDSIKDFSM